MRDQRERNSELAYPGIERMHIPLEDQDDEEFWQHWRQYNCTPLYYRAFLKHCESRVARVFDAISQARKGGIVFHCGSGRDRTGLISILLLHLARTEPSEIVEDYMISQENLKSIVNLKEETVIKTSFEQADTTIEKEILSLIEELDVTDYLLKAGLSAEQLASVQSRLID